MALTLRLLVREYLKTSKERTHRELAERLGFSAQQFSHFLNGRVAIKTHHIFAFAQLLNVRPQRILDQATEHEAALVGRSLRAEVQELRDTLADQERTIGQLRSRLRELEARVIVGEVAGGETREGGTATEVRRDQSESA